jgi:retron-type reverse transcriptase
LHDRLIKGTYRAGLILRRFIPKTGGKERPLGLPVTEDKVLQMAVSKIPEAIYEPDFLCCSFGYRPKIGAKDAVRDVSGQLQFGNFNYIAEADIRSFFDSIDHDKLLEMLKIRIDDRKFSNLIRKWLKAGIFEKDGTIINPETGTPQGGIVSPVPAIFTCIMFLMNGLKML